MCWLGGKHKQKFQQLTELLLIIKPFECTKQEWNEKHFKAVPTM